MKYLFPFWFTFLFSTVCPGAEISNLKFILTGEPLVITTDPNNNGYIQTGKLLHQESDGQYYENENHELYLVAFFNDRPSIIDRFVGFDPSYELRDLNSDGKKELLFFFHTGAHQYALKVFILNEGNAVQEHLLPVEPMLFSDMASIKPEAGYITVQNQKFTGPHEGVITTEKYQLKDAKFQLSSKQEEKVLK